MVTFVPVTNQPVMNNEHAHEEPHLESSDMLKDIVIGMSDGLTVPFALAAGMVSAVKNVNVDQTKLIILAGIAEIAAGCIAMGLGGYLAGKTESDHYESELKREYFEVEKVPEIEKAETKQVFAEWGLSDEVQEKATGEIMRDKDKWVNFMMRYELGLTKPDPARARKSAFNIGIAYIVGGLIPLSPYFFVTEALEGLKISVVITLICLFVFGFFKSKLTGINAWGGGLKVMLIGAAAAATAFFIAKWVGA
ncbi:MAG TPA: VIT1/CCC1 transporter family protein [Chitinophagaceae bacterium]|jgi:VIT1/CCC1 family predicted Fe2+/Mn2+ transporter|nr:VIT1/CCC1 transporter family protein [Chitinophagaceae bacterium]